MQPKLFLLLIILISATSCSLQKQLNNKKHFLEDHGFMVLPEDSLPSTCAEKFPCVTTEKEVTDSGWIVFGNDNQAVIDSMKKVIDSMKSVLANPPVITDSASCMAAVKYYQAKVAEYTIQVATLTAQIKNSSVEYRQRTEKLTVESTAKLAAKDVVIKNQQSDLQKLTVQNAIMAKALDDANDSMKEHLKDHKNISKTFKWFIGAIWSAYWWLILLVAICFGLYKFRKFIPYLKLIP